METDGEITIMKSRPLLPLLLLAPHLSGISGRESVRQSQSLLLSHCVMMIMEMKQQISRKNDPNHEQQQQQRSEHGVSIHRTQKDGKRRCSSAAGREYLLDRDEGYIANS